MLSQFTECDWHGIWNRHSAQTLRRGSSYFRLQKKKQTQNHQTSLKQVWSVFRKKIYSGITKIGLRMKNWGLPWTLGLFIFCDKFVKRNLRSVLEALDGSGSMTKKIALSLGLGPGSPSHENKEWRQLYLRRKIRWRLRTAFCAQTPRLPLQGILICLLIILHLL